MGLTLKVGRHAHFCFTVSEFIPAFEIALCFAKKKYCLFQVHPAPVDELERIAKENFLRIKVRKFELGPKEQRQLE